MFLLSRPSDADITEFISMLGSSSLSYSEVGATRGPIPANYSVDHNRVCLGKGPVAWERAVAALQSWQMFDLGWTQLCWPNTPRVAGANVAILIRHFGFYSLNASRIVYVIDEQDSPHRFGFAYGTLREHAESGEERFLIEYDERDNSVWYDILAFSRPSHPLARLGFPAARFLQKRFATHSQARMIQLLAGT